MAFDGDQKGVVDQWNARATEERRMANRMGGGENERNGLDRLIESGRAVGGLRVSYDFS